MHPGEALLVLLTLLLLPLKVLAILLRHWRLVFLFAVLGVIAGWFESAAEPALYEARALLGLDTRSAPLDEQLAMLRGSSVMTNVVNVRGVNALIARETGAPAEDPDSIARIWQVASDRVEEFISMLDRPLRDAGVGTEAEYREAEALRGFSRRSRAEAVSGEYEDSALVRLLVRGTHREEVRHDLEAWINAYRNRLDKLHEGSWMQLYDDLIERWGEEEARLEKRLEEYRSRHPEISPEAGDRLRRSIAKLEEIEDRRMFEWGQLESGR